MSKKCNLYIDEAGDLGIKRGTRWFVITGVVAEETDEQHIRQTINHIRTMLNLREIHFRKITDFSRKIYVCKELSKENFTYANVLLDTSKSDHFYDPIRTYNFMCRVLLERVSQYMKLNDMEGNIILSSRGTKRDGELIDYITNKLLNYKWNDVQSDVFCKIKSKPASEWDLLQLADVCATSTWKAYNPDKLGFVYPCFASNLKTHLYQREGQIMEHGLKYIGVRPGLNYFDDKEPCNK